MKYMLPKRLNAGLSVTVGKRKRARYSIQIFGMYFYHFVFFEDMFQSKIISKMIVAVQLSCCRLRGEGHSLNYHFDHKG